jgi:hypothetical protein
MGRHPWWSLWQLGCFNDSLRRPVFAAVQHGEDGGARGRLQGLLERRQPKLMAACGGSSGGD